MPLIERHSESSYISTERRAHDQCVWTNKSHMCTTTHTPFQRVCLQPLQEKKIIQFQILIILIETLITFSTQTWHSFDLVIQMRNCSFEPSWLPIAKRHFQIERIVAKAHFFEIIVYFSFQLRTPFYFVVRREQLEIERYANDYYNYLSFRLTV